jgi:hypothetical protein
MIFQVKKYLKKNLNILLRNLFDCESYQKYELSFDITKSIVTEIPVYDYQKTSMNNIKHCEKNQYYSYSSNNSTADTAHLLWIRLSIFSAKTNHSIFIHKII